MFWCPAASVGWSNDGADRASGLGWGRPVSLIRRLPFTFAFLAIMCVANALSGTLFGAVTPEALTGWGVSHDSLRQGEVYRLLSGTVLSHDLGMLLRQLVFVAAIVGAYEWIEGSRRAATTFLTIDIIGTLLVLFVALPALVHAFSLAPPAALAAFDVGMSAGGFGLIGALTAKAPYRWLWLSAICAAIAVKIWISFDVIADTAHLLCLFLGFAVESARIARCSKKS